MAKKMGRPRLAKKDTLGAVFSVRLRPKEARDVLDAIRASGQKKPDWLRSVLLAAAREKESPRSRKPSAVRVVSDIARSRFQIKQ